MIFVRHSDWPIRVVDCFGFVEMRDKIWCPCDCLRPGCKPWAIFHVKRPGQIKKFDRHKIHPDIIKKILASIPPETRAKPVEPIEDYGHIVTDLDKYWYKVRAARISGHLVWWRLEPLDGWNLSVADKLAMGRHFVTRDFQYAMR